MKALFAAALHSGFFASGAALMAMGAGLALLRNVPKQLGDLISHGFIIRIDIRDGDVLRAMEIWLAQRQAVYRTLAASFRWRDRMLDGPCRPRLILAPGRGAHLLRYRGRLILLNRETEEMGRHEGKVEYLQLRTFGRDPSILRDILAEAADAAYQFNRANEVNVAVDESWQPLDIGEARPLDSVVLRSGQMEQACAAVEKFRASRAAYRQRGIPYQFGFLFEGPPGGGKTSLVRALTGAYGLHLHILALTEVRSDTALISLLARVPPGSAVLIEDIDCAMPAREEGDEKGRRSLTLSGLLNALDGILAADGRVLFMTTNRPEVLDPALIRPGRVDLRLHLGLADQDQVRRLFLRFFPGEELLASHFSAAVPDGAFSPAELQGLLLEHADDAAAAARAAGSLSRVQEREVA